MENIKKQINDLRKEVEDMGFAALKTRVVGDNYAISFQALFDNLYIPEGLQSLTFRGIEILRGYNRVVVGGHGPYIEFSHGDLVAPVSIKKGQEWRRHPKYRNCKYEWWTVPGTDLKIYLQTNTVNYADYLPGLYYIDALECDQCYATPETEGDADEC